MQNLLTNIFSDAAGAGNRDSFEKLLQVPPADKSYVIFITARSGSTYLTHNLKRYGLGYPNEWFNPAPVSEAVKKYGVRTAEEYISYLMRQKKTDNGVFGVEAAWFSYSQMNELLNLDDVLGSETKWFFLRRKNMVAQAVSLYIASQTGVYHSHHLKDDEKVCTEGVRYDADAIMDRMTRIANQEKKVYAYLSGRGLSPIEIFYEDMIADTKKTIKLFANVLGTRASKVKSETGSSVRKVSTVLNIEYEERFRAENQDFLSDLQERRPTVLSAEKFV